MKAAFAEIDGARTRYLHAGQGPALFLVQPIGHSGDVFYRNIDALAERFTVIAPDLPGHGFSDAIDVKGAPPQRASARHLGRLADHLGLKRYAVLGSSYGGLIAALMWFDRPERVSELVIVGSGSVFHPARQQEAVLRAVYANASTAMADPSLASCRARLGNICFAPASVAEEILLVQLTYYALPDRFAAYAATIRGLIDSLPQPEHHVHGRLEALAVRSLVITGREDIRAKLDLVEAGCRRMPRVELEIFDACGHLPYMEHPERFNRRVLEFLGA